MDELRMALEMATDEELQTMTDILFRPKFNPLDYVCTPDPFEVQCQHRQDWIDSVEHRFRFLAADGFTVLRCRSDQVTYRQVLVCICRHLKIHHTPDCPTADLEAEIFLCVLESTWKRLSASEKTVIQSQLQQSLSQTPQFQQLPLPLRQDPLGLVLKGGSAIAVSTLLRPWLLQQIARQFALHLARYQVAQQALATGGSLATQVQGRAAMHLATRGMTLSAARYGAVRGLFTCLGPALWTWFLLDLGWRTIATNYGRVIPVVLTLAQIRLTRIDYAESL